MSVKEPASFALVLGGTRSGKTAYAERWALSLSSRPLYLATAEARDEDMALRIKRHQQKRGEDWDLVESRIDLLGALQHLDRPRVVLIDCLTLWLSNLCEAGEDSLSAIHNLLSGLARLPHRVIAVSNELGLGLVPADRLSRHFRDQHGLMNQSCAAHADCVVFVAAGLPLVLKGGENKALSPLAEGSSA